MGKKKILHLITGLELGGGAENMLLHLLPRMQSDLDNKVGVVSGKGEVGKKLEEKNIPVYYLNLKNYFDLGVIFRYRRLIKDFQPDVQVNYLIHADIFGRIFGKLFGVKKIVSYIRNIHKKKKLLMLIDKITLPLADFVLTNSETAKKYYIEKMGVNKFKIKSIPNAVDIKKFSEIKVNRKEKLISLGIDPESLMIASDARMEKQKDIPTLVRAFFKISQIFPKVTLLLIGHGKEKNNIRKLVSDLGLENKVTFLEKRWDIPELFGVMDIFVLPSLQEGMSNSLLQAMASGKIIITSDIQENKELIKDGFNGLNFRTGDSRDLYEKIKFCLENMEKIENYKQQASMTAREKYAMQEITESYIIFLANI